MTTAHAITMPNGKVRFMIGSKFASKANYDAFIAETTTGFPPAPVAKIPSRKSPRAQIDRKPKFILRYQANEHSIEYAGSTFDLSGLSLKAAAIVRYNVVQSMFGKDNADAMVADYAEAA